MARLCLKGILPFLLCVLLLCPATPARADHSVLPPEGQLNETQALDLTVARLCQQLDCPEEAIRGHWHYYAISYPTEEVPAWYLCAGGPEPVGGIGMLEVWLNAETGAFLEWDDEPEWFYDPDDFHFLPLIPRKDQLQPAEALDRALDLLQAALACTPEERAQWRDYHLSASVDTDRFWYHVELGRGYLPGSSNMFCWHVWLDADTGEVVWQTDPERFAGRERIRQETGSWRDWYEAEFAAYEALWGSEDNWDYRQYAEFEAHCYGNPGWPEEQFGLPREGECSYDEAVAAGQAWLALHEDGATWSVKSSAFYTDYSNLRQEELAQGITEPDRLWSIIFVNDDAPGDWILIYVDPDTGRVTDGPV